VIAEKREAADNCAVVGIKTVTVQFLKVLERERKVIERERTFWMARKLDALPRGEIGENFTARFLNLFFHRFDFVFKADFQRVRFRMLLQFFQLPLQFYNRLFEIKLMLHIAQTLVSGGGASNGEFGRLFLDENSARH